MRGVASPVLLALILTATIIDHQVCGWSANEVGQSVSTLQASNLNESLSGSIADSLERSFRSTGQIFAALTPPLGWILQNSSDESFSWYSVASLFFRIALWIIPLLILMRQGARLTAGKNLDPIKHVWQLAAARSGWAVLMIATPWLCGAVFGIAVWMLAKVGLSFADGGWFNGLISMLVVIGAIPAVLLLAGSITAVPLGMVALVNEPQADPLDSLSRGYESTFRGWLSVVANFVVVAILLVPVMIAALMFTGVMEHFVMKILRLAGSDSMADDVLRYIGLIPVAVLLTSIGLMTGGVYLLVRRRIGGQEVEDLWESMTQSKPELPELELDPMESSR
jgi:hypothetical protein